MTWRFLRYKNNDTKNDGILGWNSSSRMESYLIQYIWNIAHTKTQCVVNMRVLKRIYMQIVGAKNLYIMAYRKQNGIYMCQLMRNVRIYVVYEMPI